MSGTELQGPKKEKNGILWDHLLDFASNSSPTIADSQTMNPQKSLKAPPRNQETHPVSRNSTSSSQSEMCITRNRKRHRRIRGGSENQFPGKLHDLLEYAATNGLESTISWIRNGTAIMVHDPEKLVEILPNFFGQTKYRSFRRQLNMWHFHRIAEGPHRGAFAHPCFIRGNKELINYMNRHAPLSESPPLIENDISRRSARSNEELQPHELPMLTSSTFLPTKSDNDLCGNIPSSSLHHQLPVMDYDHTVAAQPPVSYHGDNLDERIQLFETSAIYLTESPVLSNSANKKYPKISIENLNDGDSIVFAGRKFCFLDYNSTLKEEHVVFSSDSCNPLHQECNVKLMDDIFVDASPMIVSDSLLEPLTSEMIDSIFAENGWWMSQQFLSEANLLITITEWTHFLAWIKEFLKTQQTLSHHSTTIAPRAKFEQ